MVTHVRAMPATPEFQAWFETKSKELIEHAAKIIPKQQHMPMLFVFTATEGSIVLGMPDFFETPQGKDLAAAMCRAYSRKSGIEGVILVVEAWTMIGDRDALKNYKQGDISRNPNRQECLMMTGMKGDMQMISTYAIDGSFDTKDRRLGKLIVSIDANGGSSAMIGRFSTVDETKLDS